MNKIELIANTLILLGEQPISSLDLGTDIADLVANTYDVFKKDILANYNWTFTNKQAQLNKISETPVFKYNNIFQKPSGFLRVWNVYEDSNAYCTTEDYSIKQKGIYSNSETLFIEYSSDVNEEEFPPYFTEYFSLAYAKKINMAITESTDRQQLLNSQLPEVMNRARTTDAKQESNEYIENFSIINARW